MIPNDFMKGKTGIIMGIANNHSLAFGIAQSLHNAGAKMGFTYLGEALHKRVAPIAESFGSKVCLPCDVSDYDNLDKSMQDICEALGGKIDFILHAIAWTDKEALQGRYVDTSRDIFLKTMDISCFSFTAVAKACEAYLNDDATLLTLTYDGSNRAMPSYNVMGVAKAALESSVRYLATDFGTPKGIRVNALSAGPMRTLSGAAIGDARFIYKWQGEHSQLGRNILLEEVGNSALYLLSDLSAGVTGEVHYIDGGYNNIGMLNPHVST